MTARDPRIDAYIAKARPFAQPILARIRKAVHAGCPDAGESIKWGMPAFSYKGPLAGMAAFKAHCALAFWKASLMQTVPQAKRREAMGQFGRFESIDDVPSERALVKMVKEAVALNESGARVVRRRAAPKAPPKAPADLLAALKKHGKAIAAWTDFPPSHQREYVEWITEAKTEATRARRLETAVAWIAEGRGRNWKYERGR
ncbi:MAG TPA: YdeI/OmpD-associated family protein [Vicinamibacterales bacterium]|jgi:uncharacterized protein YdeI (YjbR/CyaY-like superfamily)